LADLRVLPSAAGASAAGVETFFSGMMHNLPSVFDLVQRGCTGGLQ